MSKRILIADSNFLTMTGMSLLLTDEYPSFIIDTAKTFEDTQQMLTKNSYDFLLLDIEMIDIDHKTMIFSIKDIQSSVAILLYSFSVDNNLLKYMNDGAHGFLSKKSERKGILKAINDLVETGYHYPPEIINLLRIKTLPPDVLTDLTSREFQIFEYLAKGFSNHDIADLFKIKPSTVSTFKRKILKKLMVENIIQLSEIYNKHR